MKALVTGASGFLGSWVSRALVERGDQVRVLLRRPHEAGELTGLSIEVAKGDVTDRASVFAACHGVDIVFHLAGVVGYSRAQRTLMDAVNVEGTRHIVDACLEGGVRRLIHLSSVVAVGASFDGRQPLNEDSPYNVSHLNLGYFETKRLGEQIVQQAVRTRGLDAVILNPSTIYGGGDAKKGSRQTQLKVAQGKLPFYTSGGVSIVAVEDVVQAILTAHERGRAGERYILSGDNMTIHKLFQIIAEEAGVKPPAIYLPNLVVHGLGSLGDCLEKIGKKGPLNSENAWTSLMFHWFDHTKATRELDFHPRPAGEALRASVQWMKSKGLI
jgi:dihydroflavonol-4-reductase